MPRYMGGVFWGFLFVRLFFQSLMRAVHDVGKKICLERFYGLTDCHTSEKPTDTRSCGWDSTAYTSVPALPPPDTGLRTEYRGSRWT